MTAPLQLRKNHKFLSVSGSLKQICQPLSLFNIHLFTYLKNFHSGEQINLSTDPSWVADYYNLALYRTSEYQTTPDAFNAGLNLWPPNNPLLVFQHGRDYFQSDYGFTLCHKLNDANEFFFFSIAAAHYPMLNVCLNHLDLFEQFIFYFKDKAADILKDCESHRLSIPTQLVKAHKAIATESIRTEFLDKIKGNVFAKWLNQHEPLTPRENECLELLINYPTTSKLAHILNISKRTAETHLEHIKNKLQCHSKQELIIKLSQAAKGPSLIK